MFSFDTVNSVNIIVTRLHRYTSCNVNVIKTAIAIFVASAIFLVAPVLAEDSTSTAKPVLQNRIQKIDNKIAQISTNTQQKLEERRFKIASHEAQIKLKIQAFKDKQKAEIATRVNTNLNKINQNQTDSMLKNLDLMSSLLDKLATRVNSNSPLGDQPTSDIKDPAAANQAIADARATIDTARTAVEAQAQKDYTINVTTEAKIRLDAQAKRDQLHSDIKAVRQLVIDAKQGVSNAIRVAKSGKIATPSAEEKEGSSSGQR